jgi:hypothetical protein
VWISVRGVYRAWDQEARKIARQGDEVARPVRSRYSVLVGAERKDTGEIDDAVVVDTSLVDAMLRLTPEERLRQNDRMLRTIRELRDAFATRRADDAAREAGHQRR